MEYPSKPLYLQSPMERMFRTRDSAKEVPLQMLPRPFRIDGIHQLRPVRFDAGRFRYRQPAPSWNGAA